MKQIETDIKEGQTIYFFQKVTQLTKGKVISIGLSVQGNIIYNCAIHETQGIFPFTRKQIFTSEEEAYKSMGK